MSGYSEDFPKAMDDSSVFKTIRLILNLVTNVLMCITVFICLSFTLHGDNLNEYHWHIILCVLGYQFFMCQGIVLLSKYNSWSMFLHKSLRRQLHIGLQIIATILVAAGTGLIMSEKKTHFDTAHGTLGISALITTLISALNGFLAQRAYKISKSYGYWVKFIHYFCGVLTLILSAASLSTAFDGIAFKFWAKNEECIGALIFITWVFTILVALDFWMSTAKRIDNALRG